MNRGEFDYRVSSQEILYCKWKYNRPVRFIWNIHNTEQNKVTGRQRDDSRKVFTCSVTMKDYNTIMGRVDKTNIICSLYGVSRKSEKWWHYIFLF